MNELTNIERLLEKFGSEEAPGDSKHRYRLRRALLRSQVFEINRISADRWERMWSLTGAVVAGGAVAVVMVVSVKAVVVPVNSSSFVADVGQTIQVADAEVARESEEPNEVMDMSLFVNHASEMFAAVH